MYSLVTYQIGKKRSVYLLVRQIDQTGGVVAAKFTSEKEARACLANLIQRDMETVLRSQHNA